MVGNRGLGFCRGGPLPDLLGFFDLSLQELAFRQGEGIGQRLSFGRRAHLLPQKFKKVRLLNQAHNPKQMPTCAIGPCRWFGFDTEPD